ncbi:MAG TPA: FHA domain-containing protein, partial [Polyangiaceae bacterium]|nr:FHA domain-containing protein [Polyangiaceae bacterium]
MIPGLGKESVTLGSAPDSDIVLAGPGVFPHHARIVRQNGQLFFVDLGQGPSFANGAPVAPQQPVPYDFRVQFALGQVPVPLAHPAIVMMVLGAGNAQAPRGQIIVGRDPARASLTVLHSSVSSHHATVMLDRMMVVDHGSTSGTYLQGRPIPQNQPVPLDPNGVVAFGAIPVPVGLLAQIAQGSSPPQPSPGGGGGDPAPRKHRTVIGELSLADLQSNVISIGRTPENKVVVAHAQVSSRHAQIVKQGEQLFLEDLRSANGTFVRGQRLAPGQRVPVQNGEKVF